MQFYHSQTDPREGISLVVGPKSLASHEIFGFRRITHTITIYDKLIISNAIKIRDKTNTTNWKHVQFIFIGDGLHDSRGTSGTLVCASVSRPLVPKLKSTTSLMTLFICKLFWWACFTAKYYSLHGQYDRIVKLTCWSEHIKPPWKCNWLPKR